MPLSSGGVFASLEVGVGDGDIVGSTDGCGVGVATGEGMIEGATTSATCGADGLPPAMRVRAMVETAVTTTTAVIKAGICQNDLLLPELEGIMSGVRRGMEEIEVASSATDSMAGFESDVCALFEKAGTNFLKKVDIKTKPATTTRMMPKTAVVAAPPTKPMMELLPLAWPTRFSSWVMFSFTLDKLSCASLYALMRFSGLVADDLAERSFWTLDSISDLRTRPWERRADFCSGVMRSQSKLRPLCFPDLASCLDQNIPTH